MSEEDRQRHEIGVENLRREIEKGRLSGRGTAARDIFDRLDRKYMELAAERGTSATP
jgi:hypothetical protein